MHPEGEEEEEEGEEKRKLRHHDKTHNVLFLLLVLFRYDGSNLELCVYIALIYFTFSNLCTFYFFVCLLPWEGLEQDRKRWKTTGLHNPLGYDKNANVPQLLLGAELVEELVFHQVCQQRPQRCVATAIIQA